MKTGWVCPCCQRVYAPHVDGCEECNKGKFTFKPQIVPRPACDTGMPPVKHGSVTIECDPMIFSWNR